MQKFQKNLFLSRLGLFWVVWGWLALTLAFLGIFYWYFLVAGFFLELAIFFFSFPPPKISSCIQNFKLAGKEIILLLAFSLLIVTTYSFFSTPSIFTGRDQGAFSTAAISLSQNHSPIFSFPAEKEFFKIYGSGEALNFPGFSYTQNGNLISHFLFGYISWLASFYSLFGLGGLVLANVIIFFLFLFSFYASLRIFAKPSVALSGLFLTASSFVFFWFFKYTLSENLALGLVWFGIYQILLLEKDRAKNFFLHFSSAFLAFGLLFFTRIEAVAFLTIIAILFWIRRQKIRDKITPLWRKKIIPLLVFATIILILSLRFDIHFYQAFAKGFLRSLGFLGENPPGNPTHSFAYFWNLAKTYTFLPFFVLGILGFFYFLKKKNYSILIPYFILLPSFIYIIHPGISPDHPWMLRRYAFSVIPAGIFLGVLFLDRFFGRKKRLFFFFFVATLLALNLSLTLSYLKAQENQGMLAQIKKISQNFSSDDLVLVDRNATGDPWSMMAGPLRTVFEKQAVYFFNPSDLAKIDRSHFSKVFLIIPNSAFWTYRDSGLLKNAIPIDYYQITNYHLNILSEKNQQRSVTIPSYQKDLIYGKVYLLK